MPELTRRGFLKLTATAALAPLATRLLPEAKPQTTSIVVDGSHDISPGDAILIDSELFWVAAIDGGYMQVRRSYA